MAYASPRYSANYDFDFQYRSPPRSPPNKPHYSHARYGSFTTPSPRGSPNLKPHARRASFGQEYHQSQWQVPPRHTAHTTPRGFSATYTTPPPREYVSGFDPRGSQFRRDSARRNSAGARQPRPQWTSDSDKYFSSSPYHANVFEGDDYNCDAPPPYEPRGYYAGANRYGFKAQDSHRTPEPERPRTSTRRPTTSGRGQQQSTPKRPSTAHGHRSPPQRRQATEADAQKAGIPAGFNISNWDPTEEPLILLGSVFDANSVGRWIFDWTVFRYGAATAFSDMAGDLWVLLIGLSGRIKNADTLMHKIRRESDRTLVDGFLDGGERIWIRLKKLLRTCEDHMWASAKRNAGDGKPAKLGKDAAFVFVEGLFGRDWELDKTEKLMASIRVWIHRYDANCEAILADPSA